MYKLILSLAVFAIPFFVNASDVAFRGGGGGRGGEERGNFDRGNHENFDRGDYNNYNRAYRYGAYGTGGAVIYNDDDIPYYDDDDNDNTPN